MSFWKLCCGAPPVVTPRPPVRRQTPSVSSGAEIQPTIDVRPSRMLDRDARAYAKKLLASVRNESGTAITALLCDPLVQRLSAPQLRVIYQHADAENRATMRCHDGLPERVKAELFKFEYNTLIARTWEASTIERVARKRPQQHTLLKRWASDEARLLSGELGTFDLLQAQRLKLLLKHPIIRWIDLQTIRDAHRTADRQFHPVFEKYLPPQIRSRLQVDS